MLKSRILSFSAIFFLIIGLSPIVEARQGANSAEPSLKKEGLDYIGIGSHFNQFKSIFLVVEDDQGRVVNRQFPLTAHTYGASLQLGTYISNHFKTEVRLGSGIVSGDLDDGIMEINIKQWANWYIGPLIRVTDYANAYAMYGLSFYNADVVRNEQRRFVPPVGQEVIGTTRPVTASSTEMEEELFGNSFSTSWLVGIDFGIYDNIYWSFEYGRLLNDDESGIKVYQLNSSLKYEF